MIELAILLFLRTAFLLLLCTVYITRISLQSVCPELLESKLKEKGKESKGSKISNNRERKQIKETEESGRGKDERKLAGKGQW